MANRELQWVTDVQINAHTSAVWAVIDDLSLIPRYHPEVEKVECLSGATKRAAGVAYKCIISEGPRKGWCVEKVVEYDPNRKMTVSFPEDSWGMSEMLKNFSTELTIEPTVSGGTWVKLRAYYSPRDLKTRVANVLLIRHRMRKRAHRMLQGLKQIVEEPQLLTRPTDSISQ